MTSFHLPENQTVCWTVYFQTVCRECKLEHDAAQKHMSRIERAFDHGEPIWSIVLEINMVHDLTKDYRPEKTPLQLAKRVARCSAVGA